jgi:hypothetical protein
MAERFRLLFWGLVCAVLVSVLLEVRPLVIAVMDSAVASSQAVETA